MKRKNPHPIVRPHPAIPICIVIGALLLFFMDGTKHIGPNGGGGLVYSLSWWSILSITLAVAGLVYYLHMSRASP